jgi:uncharacterized glyoxalase superfamily protein PhnB
MIVDELSAMKKCKSSFRQNAVVSKPGDGNSVCLNLDSKDVNKKFDSAQKVKATVLMPPTKAFWRDRFSRYKDL